MGGGGDPLSNLGSLKNELMMPSDFAGKRGDDASAGGPAHGAAASGAGHSTGGPVVGGDLDDGDFDEMLLGTTPDFPSTDSFFKNFSKHPTGNGGPGK